MVKNHENVVSNVIKIDVSRYATCPNIYGGRKTAKM